MSNYFGLLRKPLHYYSQCSIKQCNRDFCIKRDYVSCKQVIHSEAHEGCGHTIEATLGDLLEQPDYAGLDYEDGSMEATVVCTECDEDEQMRTYVTGICEGKPSFDCGKFHNHCRQCPGFGSCIHDYR